MNNCDKEARMYRLAILPTPFFLSRKLKVQVQHSDRIELGSKCAPISCMILGVDLNHIAHARHTLAATVAVAACVSAAALLRLQQRPRQRLLLVRCR